MNGGQDESRIAGDRGRRILEYPDVIDIPTVTEYIDEFATRYGNGAMSVLTANEMGRRIISSVVLGNGHPTVTYAAADRTGTAVLLRYINEYCEFLKINRRIYGYSMSHRAANKAVSVIPAASDISGEWRNDSEHTEPIIMLSRLESDGHGKVYAHGRTSLCRMLCSITGYTYTVGEGDWYDRINRFYMIKIGGGRDDFSEYSAVRELLFTTPYLV